MAMLSSLELAVASICLLLIHRIGITIYRLYFHPLSHVPGPRLFALSRLPHLYNQNILGTFYKDVLTLHDKYGPIVRVAPNELSIDGSLAWDAAFAHRKTGDREWSKDTKFYRPGDDGQGIDGTGIQNIFPADIPNHRRQRRILAHAFSEKALTEQESIVQSYVDLLMQRLKEKSREGDGRADLVMWYNATTFDIIGDLTFNESFHGLENGETHPWVKIIMPFIKTTAAMRALNEFPLLKPFMLLLIGPKALGEVKQSMAYTEERISRRLALGKETERKDFMSYILRHNDEKGMLPEEIKGNSEGLILAGSETTATLLSGLTYFLSVNPKKWDRLKEEVRGAFGGEEEISMRGTAGLGYLGACLEEGLRMYPPAATTPPRFSPGADVGGVFVPEGTRLWVQQWSTYHNSSNFHDPHSFHPERWLPSSHPFYDAKFANDNRAAMQAFSAGPRNCIGKNLAYAEARIMIARIAWNFELELAPESENWLDGQKVYVLWQKPPLWMKLALSEKGKLV